MSRNFKVSSRLGREAMMSRLGLEAMMSRLGLGRFGPRSSSGFVFLDFLSLILLFFCIFYDY